MKKLEALARFGRVTASYYGGRFHVQFKEHDEDTHTADGGTLEEAVMHVYAAKRKSVADEAARAADDLQVFHKAEMAS